MKLEKEYADLSILVKNGTPTRIEEEIIYKRLDRICQILEPEHHIG
jgi:hypothetical protein